MKIQLRKFGNHRSLGTKKSFSNAPWDFHATSMFEQQFFSYQVLSSLNGICSFHGRKDIHKKIVHVYTIL